MISSPARIDCGIDCSESYVNGTSVTLTATPASGSTFAGWSGACSGIGSCTVTMDGAQSVMATFNLQPFTLTVTKSGTGNGTVTSSPTGINCGADCLEPYTSGTVVTLTPTPDTGSTFGGWSGACSGTGTCTVTMDADKSVTAIFVIDTHTLTATAGANGSISPSGSVTVNHGASQTFVISPAANYHVADVKVDGSSVGAVTTHTFTNVTANHTIEATFAVDTLPTVTITATGATATESGPTPGTFMVSRTGSTAVALTVNYAVAGTATSGSDYSALSGSVTIAAGSATALITVTPITDALVEGDETVMATLVANAAYTVGMPGSATVTIIDDDKPDTLQFSAATYDVNESGGSATITVTRTGGSGGTVGVNFSTSNGSATAGSDYTTTSETLSFGPGETSKSFTVPITDDTQFEGNETLNLSLSSPTGGATLGSPNTAVLTITDNDLPTVTLTVTKSGTGNGTVTSNPAGIDCGTDCSESYVNGTSVTLTATPASSSTFAGWSRACSGIGSCTVTMDGAQSVMATFSQAFAVSGIIRNSKKDPITGATIEVQYPAGALVGTALTDGQGSYRLNLPSGKYTLTPTKETHLFSPASRKITIKSKDVEKQNFTCKLFQINGGVKDKKNKPFSEVTVHLKQDSSTVATSTTDARGKYSFWFYNTGTYAVEPVKEGSRFNPLSIKVIITKGSKGQVNFKEAQ